MTAENQPPTRRVATIEAKAGQKRLDAQAAIARSAEQDRVDLERRRLALQFEQEKEQAREEKKLRRAQKKQARKANRRKARTELIKKASNAAPMIGRRAMITGPILAPMTVAWIGQLGFAMDTLNWWFVGGLVFAAAWELSTAFCGWMYHEARNDGDSGTIFRAATWFFAGTAGLMNYWHALPPKGELLEPTPKAAAFGVMSLSGIALWELYTLLIHRKKLRADKKLPPARPRFGLARWTQFARTTWVARSLSIKYGYTTVDEAWSAALAELDRRARTKAARKAAKRREKFAQAAAKAGRVPINLTVVRGPRTRVSTKPLTTWTQPPVVWIPTARSAVAADLTVRSGPGSQTRSETHTTAGSETQVPDPAVNGSQTHKADRSRDGSETQSPDRSETRSPDPNTDQVPDRSTEKVPDLPETGSKTQVSDPPKRTRSKTGLRKRAKRATPLDRADEAVAADAAYLAEHGRHIPAEKLASALRIGKPAALELVKQIRGGHIDVAK